MKEYNTAINPLGSISDINVILETIKYYNQTGDLEEVEQEFVEGNIFGFNITSSRKRFFSMIKKLYLKNENNDLFLKAVSNEQASSSFKKAVLYLETCRINDLFYDITINLIYKKYVENRRLITSSEIYNFLIEYGTNTKVEEWSEETVKNICSKYISFMKRLGYFEKKTRFKSTFSFPYPTEAVITYLVYLLKTAGKNDHEVYNSKLFTALMLDEASKIDLLKQGALTGYYEFSMAGDGQVSIDLKLTEERVIDELFE